MKSQGPVNLIAEGWCVARWLDGWCVQVLKEIAEGKATKAHIPYAMVGPWAVGGGSTLHKCSITPAHESCLVRASECCC